MFNSAFLAAGSKNNQISRLFVVWVFLYAVLILSLYLGRLAHHEFANHKSLFKMCLDSVRLVERDGIPEHPHAFDVIDDFTTPETGWMKPSDGIPFQIRATHIPTSSRAPAPVLPPPKNSLTSRMF